jgi:hypothetical protein
MKPLELALQYMHLVFLKGDFDALWNILGLDLKFRGPMYQFDSAEDYIKSMQENPPDRIEFELLQSFENESSACLVYQFSKSGVSTLMTQTFKTKDQKINEILLVFDRKDFENL